MIGKDQVKTELRLSRDLRPSVRRSTLAWVSLLVRQSIMHPFRSFEIRSRWSEKIEDQVKIDLKLSWGPLVIPISTIICPIPGKKSDGHIFVPTGTCSYAVHTHNILGSQSSWDFKILEMVSPFWKQSEMQYNPLKTRPIAKGLVHFELRNLSWTDRPTDRPTNIVTYRVA